MSRWIAWLAFAVMCLGILAVLCCEVFGRRRRRKRFADRPIKAFQEWCSRNYSDLGEGAVPYIEAAVRIFAEELGVHPSQLRPNDNIVRYYLHHGICAVFDDTWDHFTNEFHAYYCQFIGSKTHTEEYDAASKAFSTWVTLDDFVRGMVALACQVRRGGTD